jgi:hypothetical protein
LFSSDGAYRANPESGAAFNGALLPMAGIFQSTISYNLSDLFDDRG